MGTFYSLLMATMNAFSANQTSFHLDKQGNGFSYYIISRVHILNQNENIDVRASWSANDDLLRRSN